MQKIIRLLKKFKNTESAQLWFCVQVSPRNAGHLRLLLSETVHFAVCGVAPKLAISEPSNNLLKLPTPH